MSRYVDLNEKVTAQFYDQEHEEWTMQTVTIKDVLDSVCDEYTVLPSAQPEPIKINIDHELTKDEYERLRKDMADAPIVLFSSAQHDVPDICVGDIISRQDVIDVLSQYPFEKVVNCISIIEEFPSAQSEIIRCKDCKHRCETEDGEYNPEDIVCAYWMSDGLSETDYCSHAERRKDGTHSTNTNQSTGRLD